ncbi:MAG: proton-conducting transporter membrane subunit [Verrucomicrobiota bacterium]|nr:proton-conducting transporter membrane subunit [Verrucomicrobiota bacterium]
MAALGLGAGVAFGPGNARAWLGLTLAAVVAALVAALSVLWGGDAWEWRSAFAVGGEMLHLRLDGISAFFLVLLSVLGGAGAVYCREYWSDGKHPASAPAGRLWWSLLLLSLVMVLLSSNGLHFLIAWEIFGLSAYFLVTLDRNRPEVRAAGWLYLGASHVAVLALFAYFALLAVHTGSWDLGPMREQKELAPLFWLALFAFGIKAGVFPLHVWLPSAHANAPSHVSAILSGVTIKMGIYGLVRFTGWLPVPDGAGWVVVILGVASSVLGVAFALGQHDLKRLLAYHSVENIGIILIGLGFALVALEKGNPEWGALALAGGLLHVWNHGLFKALLFLGAGSVLHATGTREMSRLGGLWRSMPWTASLFALGAAAIAGLPPLNGFVSEWLIYLALFDATISHGPSAWAAIPAAILLGVTGALALACFIKVCGIVFLGAPRSDAAQHAHECGPAMRGAMLVLAGGCITIGLAPLLFWPSLVEATMAWRPAWGVPQAPGPLNVLGWAHVTLAAVAVLGVYWLWPRKGLSRSLTWDCGYAVPTARMQYTAGSLASTITGWFDWILCPRKHTHRPEDYFPNSASETVHTPETVLEHILEPFAVRVIRVSSAVRRFQQGRIQAYLLYLVTGIAALAIIVVMGGGR